MKILSRYVFREILASSFLATILATFVIFIEGIAPLVELLVRTGNTRMFLELCVLALPPVMVLSRLPPWISGGISRPCHSASLGL